MKRFSLWLLCLMMLICILIPFQVTVHAAFVVESPLQAVKNMAPGYNIVNTLDAIPDETSWGQPQVTEAFLDYIRSLGYNSIRIPVTWTDHTGAAPDYTIDAIWMARVKQVVDWSLARGFYVMLNVHHDSWQWAVNMPDDATVMDRFKKIWTQIAPAFKDENEKLLFEILNEPKETSAQMMQVNDQILPIIRNSGGYNNQRLVVVTGEGNDGEKALNEFTAPNDNRIIETFHFYPYQFVANTWNMPAWNTPDNLANTDSLFKRIHDKFIANNVPVILGEFGIFTMEHTYLPETRFFVSNVTKTAYKYGITTMLWDDGIDRANLVPKPWNFHPYTVNEGKGIPCSFVWPGEFYIKATNPVTDFTATLDLSGNTLSSVYNGSTQLVNGTDYTVSGTTFNLKASYFNKILTSSLGQQAVLTFKFNRGADWLVNVIRYTDPTVSPLIISSPGSFTGDVVIPFNYNGTKIKQAKATEDATGIAVNTDTSWTVWLSAGGDFAFDNIGAFTLRQKFANMFDQNSTVNIELWPSGSIDLHVQIGGAVTPTPTPTPSPSPTATSTPTPTPTLRPTATPTVWSTATPTPTLMVTPTTTRRIRVTPTRRTTPTRRVRVTPTSRRRSTGTPTPTERTVTPTPTRRVVNNTPTPPPGGYVVAYAISSDWGSGATISLTITNQTTIAVNGWALAFSFPGNQTITNLWNGTYTQSGAAVTVKDAGYNATIGANGGSTNFGFNINYSGTNAKGASFTLNGTACQVQ